MAEGLGFGVELKVDKELQHNLDKVMAALPNRLFDKVVGQALSKAAKPLRQSARAKLRGSTHGTGLLAKSLGFKRKKYKSTKIMYVAFGPKSGFKDKETGANPVNYAHLVELGVQPHSNVKGARSRSRLGRLAIAASKTAGRHPGYPKKPFLRPAMDENANKVLSIYKKAILDGLDKQVKKLAKK